MRVNLNKGVLPDMSLEDFMFLYDEKEKTEIRFVGFVGKTSQFDLAIIPTDRFEGKYLLLNLRSDRFIIFGRDDLEEPGYLEQIFQLSEEEANELREFLHTLV